MTWIISLEMDDVNEAINKIFKNLEKENTTYELAGSEVNVISFTFIGFFSSSFVHWATEIISEYLLKLLSKFLANVHFLI